MTFLSFVINIIILFFIFNLRDRIKKLERISKNNSTNFIPKLTDEKIAINLSKEKSITNEKLLNFIKEQLKKGKSKEEIEKMLLENGFSVSDINNIFSLVESPILKTETLSDSKQTKLTQTEKFISWIKEDWIMKLGAMLLLLSFGWFTIYAFLNNWITPLGLVAFGFIVGAFFILLGWWRINKYTNQGSIFIVLGSTTILLTIYAAREFYHYLSPLLALILMFISTVLVALASVKYKTFSLSLTSLILASIIPLLVNISSISYFSLFSYLLIVALGSIWVIFLTERHELTIVSFIIVTLYSLPHLLFFTEDKRILLVFAFAFTTIFFITNTFGVLKLKDKKIIPYLITAAANGLFLISWITIAVQTNWRSLTITAWMIVFIVGAFLIFKITQKREPFYIYAGISIAMLAAAISAELKGATLMIAYTIESGIVSLIAYAILNDIKITERLTLLLIGPIFLSIGNINSNAWLTGVFNKNFFVILILALTFLGLGVFYGTKIKNTQNKEIKQINRMLLIVGSIYVYILLWFSLHTGLKDNNIAVMISFSIYTIIGLICYFYGHVNEKRITKLYGGILVGFVVVRLILIDIWRMEVIGRIITFFLIGSILVSTAFLKIKNNNKLLPNNQ